MPDDLISNDYEEMFSKDWYHRSLVDVSVAIPKPPQYEPPTPPCAECLTSSCSTSCTYCSSTDNELDHSREVSTMSSRPIMKPCKPKKRPPMPLPAEAHQREAQVLDAPPPIPPPLNRLQQVHSKKTSSTSSKREGNIMTKSISRLSRSLTWASPSSKSTQQQKQQSRPCDVYTTARNNYLNSLRPNEHGYGTQKINTIQECQTSPPIPPRSGKIVKQANTPVQDPVNMFTYSDFIARRLRNPEGISLFEQSSSSGNACGKWYDLWDERTGCTEI